MIGEVSTPETRPQCLQLATELANLRSKDVELRSDVVTILGQRANDVRIVDCLRLSPPAGPQTNTLTRNGWHERTGPPLLLLTWPSTKAGDQRFIE